MNNKLKILPFLIFLFIFLPSTSFGGRFENNLQGFSNSLLNSVTERAGLILNFKGLNGAKSLGITGLTVGLEGTAGFIGTGADYQNPTHYQTIPIARLYFAKGLPFGFDIELSAVHSSILEGLGLIDPDFLNISLIGGGLKYSILDEGFLIPVSIAIRGTYTRGVFDKASIDMIGADLSVSKQLGLSFLNLTPYIGAGLLHSRLHLPLSQPFDGKSSLEGIATPVRLMGGLAATLGLMKLVGEVNYSPETTAASILASFAL